MSDLAVRLAAEAERIEEDSEHSFKGHFNAATRWGRYHLGLGLPSALLAAFASAAAFKDQTETAGILALLSTATTTVLTFLKPSERAEMHRSAGGQYQALRNRARILRQIDLAEPESLEIARGTLAELVTRRDELNQGSPAIPRTDYEVAKRDIDEGRSRYRADEARQ